MMPRAPRTECVGPSIQYIRAGRVPELGRATQVAAVSLQLSCLWNQSGKKKLLKLEWEYTEHCAMVCWCDR